MNKLALQEIDFYRIRDEVAGYCITEEARQTFLQREPLTDSKQIEHLKNLSREWSVFLSASCKNPVTFWEPVENLIDIIKARGQDFQAGGGYESGSHAFPADGLF